MTEIAVTGATGRMGETVLETATEREGISVSLAVTRDPESVAGAVSDSTAVVAAGEFAEALSEHAPDVVIDFTAPEATAEYVRAASEAGVPFLTGTTGLDETENDALDTAAKAVPVLHAANFSRGIAALRGALRSAVSTLPGYDIELTETHHDRKRDAPSGTARTILEDIDAVRAEGDETGRTDANEGNERAENERAERVYGREGEQPRTAGEIGVHARRAGDVHGEHELLLAGNEEVLTLTHRAESRGVFAAGALDAATWLVGRESGTYVFEETLNGNR